MKLLKKNIALTICGAYLLLLLFVPGFCFANSEVKFESSILSPISESVSVALPISTTKLHADPSIKTINRIVAFVNKGVITSNQVDKQIQQTIKSFTDRGATPPSISDIHAKVLDQLILEKIQLDLAARSGIKSNDLEVTDALNNIARSHKTTLDAMKTSVAATGLSYEDFRHQVENQIILEKLRQREVDSKAIVNDDEITRVLNSEAYKNRVNYHLSMILVSIPEETTNENIANKEAVAEKAYSELQSGVPFDQVSIKYSNAPNALNGGDLGWRSSAALPPNIANALSAIPVGGYTNIIKLPVGFFIFKVNEVKKHGEQQIVKQYHVRHILIKVNEITGDDEAHQKIVAIYEKLVAVRHDPTLLNQDFEKYAKQYSEDTSSINGGDIGWVSHGDTVPIFESTVINTPIGVISQPIRTQFGWHILEVIGVRESNLTQDKERSEIRQELRENKSTILYAEWLRNIRDAAYVKINDE